jgi:hypothetical protein
LLLLLRIQSVYKGREPGSFFFLNTKEKLFMLSLIKIRLWGKVGYYDEDGKTLKLLS